MQGLIRRFPSIKSIKNRIISCIGFTLAFTSLYVPQWLYYTGPDVLLYAFGNVALFLLISLMVSEDDNRNLYFYYPIFAIIIGLATATKYHGALLYILLLYVHLIKKYYKNHQFNFALMISTLLIPLVFVACNLYMFADFKLFINEILWNFNHYSGSHAGLDDPMPLITYWDVFFRYGFGIFGVVFTVLGLVHFIRNKDYKTVIAFMVLPVMTIFILSRYNLSLTRNIAFCIPVAHLLLATGLVEARYFLEKVMKEKKIASMIFASILAIMIIPHILIFYHISGFEDSRDAAQKHITENIPEGSTVYVVRGTNKNGDFYMPGIDYEKYNIIADRRDLNVGDYIVDTAGSWQRYYQTNHLFLGGDALYPNQLKAQQDAIQNYKLLCEFPSFESIYGMRFAKSEVYDIKVLGFDHQGYYYGPTIDIYICEQDLRYDYSSVTLSTENTPIQAMANSTLSLKVNIDNQSEAKLYRDSGNGIHPSKIYYRITDSDGNVILDNKNNLLPLNEDIDPAKAGNIDLNIALPSLKVSQQYMLEIDIEKENLYMLSDLGMQTLTIPIMIIQ